MGRLFQNPADRTRGVVAVRQVVVQGGKTAWLACHLHFRKLFPFETRVAGRSPIVTSVVHRETRRQRAIRPNNQRVLPGATVPLLQFAPMKAFISSSRRTELTILYPERFFSMSQSMVASTSGQSSRAI